MMMMMMMCKGLKGERIRDDEEEFFDSSDVIFSPEDRERALIRKKHTD